MQLQAIADISEICAMKGISKAILSPGSRCAPITLSFVRNPRIQTYTISDERSAAFIALGMAQHTRRPVVLVCTSGSAAYNYAPAIAEAYFRHTPLLILTADRPPEWIDQWDGQTIRQQGIYGNHIKKSFQLPVDFNHPDAVWHTERIVSEAINCANEGASGPVHINVPLREPFYPKQGVPYNFSADIKVIEAVGSEVGLREDQWRELMEQWLQYRKVLIVGGQAEPSQELDISLSKLSHKHHSVVVGDVISNLAGGEFVRHQDLFLGCDDNGRKAALQSDLLITFGQSLISKSLKTFLRDYKPKAHWHIAPFGDVGDTFQTLTKVIRASPEAFFSNMVYWRDKEALPLQQQENYFNLWQVEDKKARRLIQHFFAGRAFGEFEAVYAIIKKLPDACDLHLANSMAVRYVNYIAQLPVKTKVYANRGTSGIDGSNSTAVGTALASGRLTTLITGDMAFFYDRNAFWHNYPLPNLRIIVLNNGGGGIFRLINGPSQQPELEVYFETQQQLTAKNTAADFGFEYLCATNRKELEAALEQLFQSSENPKLLEVFSDKEINQEIFNQFKQLINNNYGE